MQIPKASASYNLATILAKQDSNYARNQLIGYFDLKFLHLYS